MSAVVSHANHVLKVSANAAWTPASVTVEFWLKNITDPGTYRYCVAHASAWSLWNSNDDGAPFMEPMAVWRSAAPAASNIVRPGVSTGTDWGHIAMTAVEGGNLTVYINGTAATPLSLAGLTRNTDSGEVWIGTHPSDPQTNNVKISDVRIWNVERTAIQISSNYQTRLTGNESGLIGYWKLNETGGNTAEDSTSNNRDAAATAASWDINDEPPCFTVVRGTSKNLSQKLQNLLNLT